MKRFAAPALLLLTGASDPPEWTQPTAPFRIAGNIYYVGTKGLAAYLIATPKGAILLDGTMAQNVPAIEANIRALGIKLSDVKILLNSHAHFDHAGGLAALKRDTGGKFAAMAGDVWALEHGKHFGDQNYVAPGFAPVKVDRVLKDGDHITLGSVTLRAVLTAGHTRGCTTWVMKMRYRGAIRDVVFPCSVSIGGNILVGNKAYPGIIRDYRASFLRLARMHADFVLPAHPEFADVLTRTDKNRMALDVLRKIVADAKAGFAAELSREQAQARRSAAP